MAQSSIERARTQAATYRDVLFTIRSNSHLPADKALANVTATLDERVKRLDRVLDGAREGAK